MDYLLSIVVPTKDRYEYLEQLVDLIISFKLPEIEMVIQDNTKENERILGFLESRDTTNIKYFHTAEQIPISLNSDKAVLNSSGEYICFIGDDDGVTKYILDGVRWMKNNGVEAAKPAEVYYIWPDASEAFRVKQAAVINYKKFTGKVKTLSSLNELLKVLKEGIPDRGNMPLAYHGIVSRRLMDRVYEKCGTYFPGNSPDIANAVALSLLDSKYVMVDLPWAIYGNCVLKGGGEGLPGRKFPPELTDIPWWAEGAEERWYKKLPKVAVGETIWPDSAIYSLKQMGRGDLLSSFNLYKCYARFLIAYPKLSHFIYDVCDNRSALRIAHFQLIVSKYIGAFLRRVKWMLGIDKPLQELNIANISECVSKLESLTDGVIKY